MLVDSIEYLKPRTSQPISDYHWMQVAARDQDQKLSIESQIPDPPPEED